MSGSRNKRSSRKASSKSKIKAPDWGHEFQVYGVSDAVYKTKKSIQDWACSKRAKDWFPIDQLRESVSDESNRKGALKSKKMMISAVEAYCTKQLRKDRKDKLKPFIKAVRNADVDDVVEWFEQYSLVLNPSREEVVAWEDIGFTVAMIFNLIDSRNNMVHAKLLLNEGDWQALVELYLQVLRGDIAFVLECASESESGDENTTTDNIERSSSSSGRNKKREENECSDERSSSNSNNSSGVHGRGQKRKLSEVYDSEASNNGRERKRTKALHHHRFIAREFGETASNHSVRARQGNKHPYFLLADSGETRFTIATIDDNAQFLQQFTSTMNDRYCFDECVEYFEQDIMVLQRLLLNKHGLKKLHKRITAQHSLIVAFTNGRFGNKELRYSARTEYRLGCCIAEFMGLLTRIKEEKNAWTIHQKLVAAEPASNDYVVAEFSNLNEKDCRLPRSHSQVEAAKKQKVVIRHNTQFYLRLSPLKIKQSMADDEFQKLVYRWKVFKVTNWLKEYVANFFPNEMEESMSADLFPDSHAVSENADVLKNAEEQKDDDSLFNCI